VGVAYRRSVEVGKTADEIVADRPTEGKARPSFWSEGLAQLSCSMFEFGNESF
jgi:hypothetical protein